MGAVYAVQGQVNESSQSFARARAVYLGLDHYRNVGWLFFEELRVVLTYESECVVERRRLADEAEHALARASAVQASLPPHFVRLPLWLLEGQWDEAIQVADMVD